MTILFSTYKAVGLFSCRAGERLPFGVNSKNASGARHFYIHTQRKRNILWLHKHQYFNFQTSLPLPTFPLRKKKKKKGKKVFITFKKPNFTEHLYIGTVSDTFNYTNSMVCFQFSNFPFTNIFPTYYRSLFFP